MVIKYSSGITHFLLKVTSRQGSVFPFAAAVAVPNALLTLLFKIFLDSFQDDVDLLKEIPLQIVRDSAVWSGFSFLVGFLIVFRTSEAYDRFWSGCHATHSMRAAWWNAISSMIAFCKYSSAPRQRVIVFEQLMIRLFSILHAVAAAEIEDCESDDPASVHALQYPLIDVDALDQESLLTLKNSKCKTELVYQWIQQLIVENMRREIMSIPAPLLSHSYDDLAQGMMFFNEAMKISTIPFPFPYAQTCHWLLVMHWLLVPVVAAQWVSGAGWASVFAFIQVFVLWSLNRIATEIENPFGMDANDLDAAAMQEEFNHFLSQLVSMPQIRSPQMTVEAQTACMSLGVTQWRRISLRDSWQLLHLRPPPASPRNSYASFASIDGPQLHSSEHGSQVLSKASSGPQTITESWGSAYSRGSQQSMARSVRGRRSYKRATTWQVLPTPGGSASTTKERSERYGPNSAPQQMLSSSQDAARWAPPHGSGGGSPSRDCTSPVPSMGLGPIREIFSEPQQTQSPPRSPHHTHQHQTQGQSGFQMAGHGAAPSAATAAAAAAVAAATDNEKRLVSENSLRIEDPRNESEQVSCLKRGHPAVRINNNASGRLTSAV